jgi:DNA-binding Xre family transcriptional regulator
MYWAFNCSFVHPKNLHNTSGDTAGFIILVLVVITDVNVQSFICYTNISLLNNRKNFKFVEINFVTMTKNETKIDILMAEHNISSYAELAPKIGLSQQSLSYRLSGKISMDTLERMATYFGVTVKELLK